MKLFSTLMAFILLLGSGATVSADHGLNGWRGTTANSLGVVVNATDSALLNAIPVAMSDWSLSPVVEMSQANKGKITVNQRSGGCIGCSITYFKGGYISEVIIYIDPAQVVQFDLSMQWVVCHELGHALGLGHQTNYNPPQSCLSNSFAGDHPNAHDYETLLLMYGGG